MILLRQTESPLMELFVFEKPVDLNTLNFTDAVQYTVRFRLTSLYEV